MNTKISITQYGFIFGPAEVTRCCSDKKKGYVFLEISTPKRKKDPVQIYVTRTGNVRIYSDKGEWQSP